MKMSKTQTGAKRGNKNPRVNWKKVYVQTCKTMGDKNIEISNLQQQLAEAQERIERQTTAIDGLNARISGAQKDLYEGLTAKNQLAIANTDIKIVEECIREICDRFHCARDHDDFELMNINFAKLPINPNLIGPVKSLLDWIGDFSTRAKETKDALANAETETKKWEAVAGALTDIIQKAIRR